MTTAWAHLPNAALIDEVLASLEAHLGKWGAASDAASDAARNAAWNAARGAAWDAAWGAAWDAAADAVQGTTQDIPWGPTWDTAWGVIAALLAYDGAGQFMKMPVEHLQRLYRIDPHPMYLLLQPAATVFAED